MFKLVFHVNKLWFKDNNFGMQMSDSANTSVLLFPGSKLNAHREREKLNQLSAL